jgi:hypothetical protein
MGLLAEEGRRLALAVGRAGACAGAACAGGVGTSAPGLSGSAAGAGGGLVYGRTPPVPNDAIKSGGVPIDRANPERS